MPNEFVRTIAELLKPKVPAGSNVTDVVERLVGASDAITIGDSITAGTSALSRLVGTATVGYSECA